MNGEKERGETPIREQYGVQSPLCEFSNPVERFAFSLPATRPGYVLEIVQSRTKVFGVVGVHVETRNGDSRLHNCGKTSIGRRNTLVNDFGIDRCQLPLFPVRSTRFPRTDLPDFDFDPCVSGGEHGTRFFPNRERGIHEIDGVARELDDAAALTVEIPSGSRVAPRFRGYGRPRVKAEGRHVPQIVRAERRNDRLGHTPQFDWPIGFR